MVPGEQVVSNGFSATTMTAMAGRKTTWTKNLIGGSTGSGRKEKKRMRTLKNGN